VDQQIDWVMWLEICRSFSDDVMLVVENRFPNHCNGIALSISFAAARN
jgi:hypothetical protein